MGKATTASRKEVTSSLTTYLEKLYVSESGVYHQAVIIGNLLKHPNPDVRAKAEEFLQKAEIGLASPEGIEDMVSCGFEKELALFFSLKKSAEELKEKNAQDASQSTISGNPVQGPDLPPNPKEAKAQRASLIRSWFERADNSDSLCKALMVIVAEAVNGPDDEIGKVACDYVNKWGRELMDSKAIQDIVSSGSEIDLAALWYLIGIDQGREVA